MVAEAGGEEGEKILRICIRQQRTRIDFSFSISCRIHTTHTTFRIGIDEDGHGHCTSLGDDNREGLIARRAQNRGHFNEDLGPLPLRLVVRGMMVVQPPVWCCATKMQCEMGQDRAISQQPRGLRLRACLLTGTQDCPQQHVARPCCGSVATRSLCTAHERLSLSSHRGSGASHSNQNSTHTGVLLPTLSLEQLRPEALLLVAKFAGRFLDLLIFQPQLLCFCSWARAQS